MERGQSIELVNGTVVQAIPGDWIIGRGSTILDVCTDKILTERYEELIDALRIDRATCVRLETTLGVGTTRNAYEMVQAVERLATIQIGEVKVDFTPGQLSELKHRAAKRGYTVEQEITRIVDRIKDEIFHHS